MRTETFYRNLLFSCVLIFCFSPGQAQNECEQHSASNGNENNLVYINEVIDKRNNTTTVGSYINKWGERKSFNPDKGLAAVAERILAQFYFNKKLLPEIKGREKVTLVINEFEMQMERSSVEELKARINYNFGFFDNSDPNAPVRIFRIQSYKDSVYNEYLGYVEIEVEDFLSGFVEQTFVDAAEVFFEKKTDNKVMELSSVKTTESSLFVEKPDPLARWSNLLTCSRIFGKHQSGWRITYYGYAEDPSKDYFVPYISSFNFTKSDGSSVTKKGIKSVNAYSIEPGTRFFVSLFPEVYANIELLIPLGMESVKYDNGEKKRSFLYGVNASQGIYFIGKRNEDIVLGVNVYERFVKSKAKSTDFGFSLELGIKF